MNSFLFRRHYKRAGHCKAHKAMVPLALLLLSLSVQSLLEWAPPCLVHNCNSIAIQLQIKCITKQQLESVHSTSTAVVFAQSAIHCNSTAGQVHHEAAAQGPCVRAWQRGAAPGSQGAVMAMIIGSAFASTIITREGEVG